MGEIARVADTEDRRDEGERIHGKIAFQVMERAAERTHDRRE